MLTYIEEYKRKRVLVDDTHKGTVVSASMYREPSMALAVQLDDDTIGPEEGLVFVSEERVSVLGEEKN